MLPENDNIKKPLNTMTDKKYNPKAIAKTIDVEELYDLDVTITVCVPEASWSGKTIFLRF